MRLSLISVRGKNTPGENEKEEQFIVMTNENEKKLNDKG